MYTQQERKDIYIGEIFEFIQQILDLKKYKKHIRDVIKKYFFLK